MGMTRGIRSRSTGESFLSGCSWRLGVVVFADFTPRFLPNRGILRRVPASLVKAHG